MRKDRNNLYHIGYNRERQKAKLIVWLSDSNSIHKGNENEEDLGKGSLIRSSDPPAEPINERLYVSACVRERADLRVAAFIPGSLKLLGDSGNQFARIEGNALAVQDERTLVSAVRTTDDNLRLIQWTVDFSQGGVARTGDVAAGEMRVSNRAQPSTAKACTRQSANRDVRSERRVRSKLISWKPCGLGGVQIP